jgi:hypothetical protein
LWTTQKLLPLVKGGEFARSLERSREAASALFRKVAESEDFLAAFAPELDIVIFAPRAATATESSRLARQIFEAAARHDLHLALADLPVKFLSADRETVTCLRSVLMKPEHLDWVDGIWERLQAANREVRGGH